jgi:sodium transport system permease protein
MSLMGAFYPAIDLSAGEKERGTMQTLLCAPISPREIILGKFLSVWTMAILMTLANLASVGFAMSRIASQLGGMASASLFVVTFLALLPVTFFISAVFLGLAVFAKDYKDGQNQLMPVFLPAYLLAGAAAMPGVELTAKTALFPIVNVSLLVKAAFLGEATLPLVALTVGASVVYALLALFLAARVFEREDVLLGASSLKKLFKRG